MARNWSRSLVVISTLFSSSRRREDGISTKSVLRAKVPRRVKASHRASSSSSLARASPHAILQLTFESLKQFGLFLGFTLKLNGEPCPSLDFGPKLSHLL